MIVKRITTLFAWFHPVTVHSFLIHPASNSLVSNSPRKTTTRTTRTTTRTTKTTTRTIRTTPISSHPLGGLLICMVLKPLKPILVVLVVVLVVVLWGELETSELEMG